VRRLRRDRRIVDVVLVAVLVAAGVGTWYVIAGQSSTAAAATRTATVTPGTVLASVSASGTLQPVAQADASFGTSGTVKVVRVHVGQHVTKGQVLAELDRGAQYRQLAAAELSAEAASDGASSASSAKGATTQSIAQAQATLASANASLYQAQQAYDATLLRAPISGTVIALDGSVGGSSGGSSSASSASSGSSVGSGSGSGSGSSSTSSGTGSSSSSAGSGFATIADLGHLEARAYFSEADATNLKVGQPVTVTFDALPGKASSGRVSFVDPTPTTQSNVVEYGVTVHLAHPPSGLRNGQTAEVSVQTGRASGLTVPTIAVHRQGAAATVTVVRDGTQTVPVTLGLQGDQTTIVRSGLRRGDRIVLATPGSGSAATFGAGGFARALGAGGGLGAGRLGGAPRGGP
jgi:membrane fusion protein, macrolide-specific efflux system